jgi:hypothetical protein
VRAFVVSIMLAAAVAGASADILVGNGKVKSERRSLSSFSSVSVAGSGTLRLHRGGQKVELTCDSNILPYITTTVTGSELRIGFKPFTGILKATKMEFDVTIPELAAVRLAGSGDAYVDSFSGDTFEASVAGSGGIKAELEYRNISLNCSGSGGFDASVKSDGLELRCSGSGSAYVKGSAERAEVTISGSGTLGARGFSVSDARIIISGSGEAEIRVAKSLDAVLSGSGSVRYWGKPSIQQRVSGSGRISRAGG